MLQYLRTSSWANNGTQMRYQFSSPLAALPMSVRMRDPILVKVETAGTSRAKNPSGMCFETASTRGHFMVVVRKNRLLSYRMRLAWGEEGFPPVPRHMYFVVGE